VRSLEEFAVIEAWIPAFSRMTSVRISMLISHMLSRGNGNQLGYLTKEER
jgi:hypothetical protein